MSPQLIISVVAVCVALLGMLSAAALGTLGLLLNLAAILWKGGQIVQATEATKVALDEHRKESKEQWKTHDAEISEARHLARDAVTKVNTLRAEVFGPEVPVRRAARGR